MKTRIRLFSSLLLMACLVLIGSPSVHPQHQAKLRANDFKQVFDYFKAGYIANFRTASLDGNTDQWTIVILGATAQLKQLPNELLPNSGKLITCDMQSVYAAGKVMDLFRDADKVSWRSFLTKYADLLDMGELAAMSLKTPPAKKRAKVSTVGAVYLNRDELLRLRRPSFLATRA